MSEDEEKIDALVVEVQTLQQYFPKPTLKTKYLKRAPFPFLHDIFWGAAKGCGFGAGLFGDSKFKPPKTYDRTEKELFCARAIKACSLGANTDLSMVSIGQILAGQAAYNTLLWLQALSVCCNNAGSLDNGQIINQVNEELGSWPPGSEAEAAEAEDTAAADAARAQQEAAAEAERQAQQEAKARQEAEAKARQEAKARARKKKEAQEREAAAAAASVAAQDTTDSGGGGGSGGDFELPDVTGLGFIEKTTALCQALFAKPSMNAGRLGRPPHKFIQAIVSTTMKVTGWQGVEFDADELDSKAFKANPRLKITYLDKLLAAVQEVRRCSPPLQDVVRPIAVCKGEEAENTNFLIQEFIYAACGVTSGSSPIQQPRQVSARVKDPEPESEPEPVTATKPVRVQKPPANVNIPSLGLAIGNLAGDNDSKQLNKYYPQEQSENKSSVRSSRNSNTVKRLVTARRGPTKPKNNNLAVTGGQREETHESKQTLGVMLEGDDAEDDDDDDEEEEEPEQLQELFHDPALAGDGEHGIVMKDLMKAMDQGREKKEETGIQFKRLQSSRPDSRTQGQLFSKAQIDLLRKQIQALCQSANPLGKCIDFVQDDMDQMQKEHQKWRRAYAKYTEQLAEEKELTKEMLDPLQAQLDEVINKIAEENRAIKEATGRIIKNEKQIQKVMNQKLAM